MKVLFIGGTGIISSACASLAVTKGIDLTLLNRGKSVRPALEGTRWLQADIHDLESTRSALAGQHFDVVVDGSLSSQRKCNGISTSSKEKPGNTFSSARPRLTRPQRRTYRSVNPPPLKTMSGNTRAIKSPVKSSWSGIPREQVSIYHRPAFTYLRPVLRPFQGGTRSLTGCCGANRFLFMVTAPRSGRSSTTQILPKGLSACSAIPTLVERFSTSPQMSGLPGIKSTFSSPRQPG